MNDTQFITRSGVKRLAYGGSGAVALMIATSVVIPKWNELSDSTVKLKAAEATIEKIEADIRDMKASQKRQWELIADELHYRPRP
jgi:hypothetical protein